MKYFKWGFISVFVIFILAQFFRPDRDLGDPDLPTDLFKQVTIEDSLKNILLKSCYDCHSNHTDYPWYASIVPLTQMINRHVRDGKQKLNFSLWGTYSNQEQVGLLSEICEVIEDKEMPLKSYLLLHREARLDDSQKEKICSWSEHQGMKILFAE